ncbi:hypothetical protein GF377_03990, partial [candidate division GN15 bacterium]|nr:hypothetical protein [candidate division GN15 bacterium]
MSMTEQNHIAPTITIVHEIPGRMRYRLSRKLDDPAALTSRVRGHDGIEDVAYT